MVQDTRFNKIYIYDAKIACNKVAPCVVGLIGFDNINRFISILSQLATENFNCINHAFG